MPADKKPARRASSKKTPSKKRVTRKTSAKKPTIKTRQSNNSKEPQLIYSLNSQNKMTIDRLQKWTKFVGIMNIITGIIYCLTILIFSIPTVIMGIITILMGSKLTIAANHLSFALDHNDNKSFEIALDQLHRYFLINGALFIVTLIFIAMLIVLASFFASIFIEFFNDRNFNYSISLINNLGFLLR